MASTRHSATRRMSFSSSTVQGTTLMPRAWQSSTDSHSQSSRTGPSGTFSGSFAGFLIQLRPPTTHSGSFAGFLIPLRPPTTRSGSFAGFLIQLRPPTTRSGSFAGFLIPLKASADGLPLWSSLKYRVPSADARKKAEEPTPGGPGVTSSARYRRPTP